MTLPNAPLGERAATLRGSPAAHRRPLCSLSWRWWSISWVNKSLFPAAQTNNYKKADQRKRSDPGGLDPRPSTAAGFGDGAARPRTIAELIIEFEASINSFQLTSPQRFEAVPPLSGSQPLQPSAASLQTPAGSQRVW